MVPSLAQKTTMGLGEKHANDTKSEHNVIFNSSHETAKDEKAKKGFRAQLTGVFIFILFLFIIIIGLAAALGMGQKAEHPHCQAVSVTPLCPDGWVGYQGKCYYFSSDETDWISSLRNCSALNASLSMIETEIEMAFLLRYKGETYHWIGLKQDPGEPWKWANGRAFNYSFPIAEGGDCAYLNGIGIITSWCKTKKNWICSKPDISTQ